MTTATNDMPSAVIKRNAWEPTLSQALAAQEKAKRRNRRLAGVYQRVLDMEEERKLLLIVNDRLHAQHKRHARQHELSPDSTDNRGKSGRIVGGGLRSLAKRDWQKRFAGNN